MKLGSRYRLTIFSRNPNANGGLADAEVGRYTVAGPTSADPCLGDKVLRKVVRQRESLHTIDHASTRESDDNGHERPRVLQRTSRFRAHDENDDGGHRYQTARYPTRFD
jgi:hypothetical protein